MSRPDPAELRRRLRALALVALFLVVLAGCRADVGVDIDVHADGSGTVAVEARLDEAVVQTLGEPGDVVGAEDLERAGWAIVIERVESDGAVVSATKSVLGPRLWQQTLDEIVGPGVFRDVRVERDGGGQRLAFELDLGPGWDLFADPEIAAALGGEPFGAPIEQLAGDASIDDIVAVELDLGIRNLADGVPTTASYRPRFGGEPLRINLVASQSDTTADLLRWIAGSLLFLAALATVLAVVGIVLQRRADRTRPAAVPASLASRLPGGPLGHGASSAPAAASEPAPVARAEASIRLVVIEPLAVLYDQARTFDEVIVPFVRRHDGAASDDTIESGYRELLTGRLTTAEFWAGCGLDGPAASGSTRPSGPGLDADLVSGRVLVDEARAFFDELHRRGLPIAAITDDASEWATATRARDRLSVVSPWLVSAETGAVLADAAMFEVLRRQSGVAHSQCLYLAGDVDSLDAAKALGMATVLVDRGTVDLPAVIGHHVVSGLGAVFGRAR